MEETFKITFFKVPAMSGGTIFKTRLIKALSNHFRNNQLIDFCPSWEAQEVFAQMSIAILKE